MIASGIVVLDSEDEDEVKTYDWTSPGKEGVRGTYRKIDVSGHPLYEECMKRRGDTLDEAELSAES